MALNNFFKINLPYGFERGYNNEWTAFNREYLPLGFKDTRLQIKNETQFLFSKDPIFICYKGLTERKILSVAENVIRCPKSNEIIKFFLYSDTTNPTSQKNEVKTNICWEEYMQKIRILSKLKRI